MSECVIIAVDNSEYALNEDHPMGRFAAQRDVVTLLATTKLDSNPETSVGILSLAGKSPTVVVTPTKVNGME
jgi:26S proteasome regulatory subunit N10